MEIVPRRLPLGKTRGGSGWEAWPKMCGRVASIVSPFAKAEMGMKLSVSTVFNFILTTTSFAHKQIQVSPFLFAKVVR